MEYFLIVSLAIFGLTNSLTIDNQVNVVRNDCYERLALGHKLKPQDVDKKLDVTTVQECQMACTEEEEKCRSFSFGIGVKGNATCELSRTTVKETPDLRPIGTINDLDYDLYIKKLGCKLVIPQDFTKTSERPAAQYTERPPEATSRPSSNYTNNQFSKPYRVQSSYISVATGPNALDTRYGTGRPYKINDRPSYLNRPYDDKYSPKQYPPAYLSHSDDRLDFDPRPHRPDNYYPYKPNRNDEFPGPFRPDRVDDYRPLKPNAYDFSYPWRPDRPSKIPDRPEPVGNYGPKPFRPDRIPVRPEHQSDYDSIPDRPNSVYENNNRPPPNKIPSRPDHYYPPERPTYIPNRPENYDPPIYISNRPDYNYNPHRPDKIPERPTDYGPNPNYPERPVKVPARPDDYGSTHIPNRPEDYEFKPQRPIKIPERPTDYGSIPERPDNYGASQYRPEPPLHIPNRPNDYDFKPQRPIKIPERPDDYGPLHFGPTHIPNRPDDYDFKPQRPMKIPERPTDYGSIPERPIKVPERPDNYGALQYGPEPPPHIPNRPDNYDYKPPRPIKIPDDYPHPVGYGPQRPVKVPNRPDDYDPRPPKDDNYFYDRPRPFGPHRPLKGDYDNNKPLRPYDYTPYHRPHSEINSLDYDPEPYRPRNRYDYGNRYGPGDRKQFWNGYDNRFMPPPRPTLPFDYKENKEEKSNASNSSDVSIKTEEKDNATDNAKGDRYQPVVTESVGPHGNTITSILSEIKEACFRRVLAGKRILRSFVRKAVPCERLEDCQRECSDERRFVCEGFNYRLDPTGRGQGDCELIDLPVSRLDIRRDVVTDADYDYYERDRNSDAPDCKGTRYYGSYSGEKRDYYESSRRNDYYDNYYYDNYYSRHRQPRPDNYDDYDYYYYGNRRGDYKDDYGDYGHYYYKPDHHHQNEKPSYLPHPHNDFKSYEPYLPPHYSKSGDYWHKYFEERAKDKSHWGFKESKGDWGNYGGNYGNFGAPDSYFYYDHQTYPKYNTSYKKYYFEPYDSKDWGRYGGTYGYSEGKYSHNHKDSYDYWGLKKYDDSNNLLPPYQSKPEYTGSYLPPYEPGHDYIGVKHEYYDRPQHHDHQHHDHQHHDHHHHDQQHHDYQHHDHHHYGDYQGHIKDQCSLRMAAGFRLHKGIIKKITSVPNIYECELLCYRERDFPCSSYAFRYTVINNVHKENCYLSDRSYKELDYYTDLEPDRDYDIYTINNKDTCLKPTPKPVQERSDCFWRVRSGQRLDHRIVRDSLSVKSIVDCQVECLRSRFFTCRAFSYRYGPPVIGGAIDNCQLTDWIYHDLNPHIHFVPEPGYEIYERGSYGYGCEPNHVEVGHRPSLTPEDKMDQVCYLKYGTSARLLPQATKKSIVVANEVECKAECTRAREKGTFQCMSFSFRLQAVKGTPNCDLSDILQRDLLSNVDYVPDPDAWLFAWDLHNPKCVSVIVVGSTIFGGESIIEDHGGHHKEDGFPSWPAVGRPQDTWKVYSVNGLPCKRGTFCQENKVAGFWYCELENKEEFSWDYCCNPDHHCGYSEGFPYQWCYVGSKKTQWRKCNDHYYPYGSSITDRYDYHHPHTYLSGPSSNHVPDYPSKPSFRPDRPPPDDYFLDPPKPGGFGQSRHWPISYLHKELPQNSSLPDLDPKMDLPKVPKSRNIDTNYQAIGNLIETIKSSELKKLQLSNNTSEKSSDSLHVKIPLPTNKTDSQVIGLETVDITTPRQNDTGNTWQKAGRNGRVYTRSYITKTNRTSLNEEHKRGYESFSIS